MKNELMDLQIEAWVDELDKALSKPVDYGEAGRIVRGIMRATYDDVARLRCRICSTGDTPEYDNHYRAWYHERELCWANDIYQHVKEILA